MEDDEMNYTLTTDEKKLLTEEVLGKCWHIIVDWIPGRHSCVYCAKCQKEVAPLDAICELSNRTFTSPQDRHDLAVALMRDGLWEKFGWFTVKHWQLSDREEGISNTEFGHMYYLLVEQPERFCKMCAEFWKEKL
jgi:hypothetical protein